MIAVLYITYFCTYVIFNCNVTDGSTGPVFAEDHLCFSLLPSSVESVTSTFLQRSNVDLKMLTAKVNLKPVG